MAEKSKGLGIGVLDWESPDEASVLELLLFGEGVLPSDKINK